MWTYCQTVAEILAEWLFLWNPISFGNEYIEQIVQNLYHVEECSIALFCYGTETYELTLKGYNYK
jgi:hypothetical protein